VVNTLHQVVGYDWRGFWTDRLTSHGPGAPLGGIEGSGWNVVYDETESEMLKNNRAAAAVYSLGLVMREDGSINDTIEGMPAAVAGIGPGMKLVAVNGHRYTPDVMRSALKAGKAGSAPLELLVENTDYFKTYKIDYHGGERYPHLVRDESKPDLLTEIYRAK
jgi:predicted metalloprotease with PDZ domain